MSLHQPLTALRLDVSRTSRNQAPTDQDENDGSQGTSSPGLEHRRSWNGSTVGPHESLQPLYPAADRGAASGGILGQEQHLGHDVDAFVTEAQHER